MTGIDPRRYREVLGHYPTGVVLVTALVDGEPVGMVVGSFTSVSLDPPLVAYLPMATSHSFARIRQAEHFCVNVLSAEQEALCRRMASRAEDKWSGVSWSPSPHGVPVLDDAVAWIECSTESVTEAGDHFLVLGRVQELVVAHPVTPLLFFQGGYGRFAVSSLVAAQSPDIAAAIQAAELARDDLSALARRVGADVGLVAQVGDDLVHVGAAGADAIEVAGTALGTRSPFLAPLGEQLAAAVDDSARDAWLRRGRVDDPDVRARTLRRVDLARHRGWSLWVLPQADEADYHETVRRLADADLDPAFERRLLDRLVAWRDAYSLVDEIDDGSAYDVQALWVGVSAAPGWPTLALRVDNLSRPAPGADVRQWIGAARTTATRIGQRLAAGPPAGAEHF